MKVSNREIGILSVPYHMLAHQTQHPLLATCLVQEDAAAGVGSVRRTPRSEEQQQRHVGAAGFNVEDDGDVGVGDVER